MASSCNYRRPLYVPKGRRGLCLIINNVNYENEYNSRLLENRTGSDVDVEALRSVFNNNRRFTVQVFRDRTADEIHDHLIALNNSSNEHYWCLFVFFLAHGYEGGIYGVDGQEVSINSIQWHLCTLNCPVFADKPKILTFQSCREIHNDIVAGAFGMTEDHFLLAFAAQPNSPSFRHIKRGTYYIQCLVHVIEEKGEEEDYLSMLTIVRREIQGTETSQKPIVHNFLIDKVFIEKSTKVSSSIAPTLIHSGSSIIITQHSEVVVPHNQSAQNIEENAEQSIKIASLSSVEVDKTIVQDQNLIDSYDFIDIHEIEKIQQSCNEEFKQEQLWKNQIEQQNSPCGGSNTCTISSVENSETKIQRPSESNIESTENHTKKLFIQGNTYHITKDGEDYITPEDFIYVHPPKYKEE